MKHIFVKYRFSEDYKENSIVDSLQKPSEYENNIKNGSITRSISLINKAIVLTKQLKKYIKVIYNGTN